MNHVDRSLLGIFSGEQAEHLSGIRALLDNLGSSEAVDELLRRLHTLKGAARAVGLDQTEQLTHQAEEVLSRLRRGALESSLESVRRALERTADAIEDTLAAVLADRTPPGSSDVLQQLAHLAGSAAPPRLAAVAETPAPDPTPAPQPSPELLRISARSLDDLIRHSSELLIDSTAEAGQLRSAAHASRLDDTSREWLRLRRAAAPALHEFARHPEFHAIAECISFIDGRLQILNREASAVSAISDNTVRNLRERAGRVYQGACRIRMTSAETVLGAFGPMVRDLAQQEGREIAFHAAGLDTNADLLVLQSLKDPVMHLLRNAVSHGIETPPQRLRAGKPPEGEVHLRLSSRGDRLTLLIEDDGRGLDYENVAREARNRGLLGEDELADNPREMARLLFRPGFSTSQAITGVSGRGMGLSIVQRAVTRLRGEIAIHPRAGGGTSIAISVPISISTQHVLLVSAGGHTFGIAAAFVEGLDRIKPSDIRNLNGRESIVTSAGPVPFAQLAPLLGLNQAPASAGEEPDIPCLILNLNGRRAALAADRLVDEREAIIKDTGLPETASGITAGAIPMEDGTVAVMLNAGGIYELMSRSRRVPAVIAPPQKTRTRKGRILVVDDSLTTRSLEKSILEAHGYEVKLAVDGLEALERLRIETPDLVISDVMMPRLTGFQLLEKMKSDATMKNIPVILVTSLESREEQHTGLSLGADAYIVKRKFDQRELLNVIREII